MKSAESGEAVLMAEVEFEVESIPREGYISLASSVLLRLPRADKISDIYY